MLTRLPSLIVYSLDANQSAIITRPSKITACESVTVGISSKFLKLHKSKP